MEYKDITLNQKVRFHLSDVNWEPNLRPRDGMTGIVVEKQPEACYEPGEHAARVVWDSAVINTNYGTGPWWYPAEDLYPAVTGEF